ncbi:MAG: hypothetical protein U0K59_03700, partial [Bacteroidales bacterium]|nr:hypothetical protein [Bacteroidales bacterium]
LYDVFHNEKHSVSRRETLCFSKGNTLFLQEKHIVSQRETDSETSPRISQKKNEVGLRKND